MMKTLIVPKPIIDEVWPRVENWLASAIQKGDRWWTLGKLRDELNNDNAALFVTADKDGIYGAAAVVVEVQPNGERVAHFPAMGGNGFVSNWGHEALKVVEDWAQDQGATRISITGRRGWRKILPDYKQTAVVIEKVLK